MLDPLRVAVAQPERLLRRAIVSTLSSQPGLEVVGEAADTGTARACCAERRPDVVLLTEDVPSRGALDPGLVIRSLVEGCGLVVLTDHFSASMLMEQVREGFDGYLDHSLTPAELGNALRAAHRGLLVVPRSVALWWCRGSRRMRSGVPAGGNPRADVSPE